MLSSTEDPEEQGSILDPELNRFSLPDHDLLPESNPHWIDQVFQENPGNESSPWNSTSVLENQDSVGLFLSIPGGETSFNVSQVTRIQIGDRMNFPAAEDLETSQMKLHLIEGLI